MSVHIFNRCGILTDEFRHHIMRRVEDTTALKTRQRMADALQNGFSRAHGVMLSPACPSCTACKPIRIPVADYEPRRSHRRLLTLNRTVDVIPIKEMGKNFNEHLNIYHQWIMRHYPDMPRLEAKNSLLRHTETRPVQRHIFEFRDWIKRDRLLGASIYTVLPEHKIAYGDGYYYDTDKAFNKRSLGMTMNVMMLCHFRDQGFKHVYFGDWTMKQSAYTYKGIYTDKAEVFDRGQWVSLADYKAKATKKAAPTL